MDCPHCQTENLVGARRCASCGESMVSQNRFGPPPTDPPLEPAATIAPAHAVSENVREDAPPQSGAPDQAMCRICRTPCDVPAGMTASQAVCVSCKILGEMNAAAAAGEIRPETTAEANAEFGAKLGTATNRPRIVVTRRKVVRTGPVAVVVAVVLTLLCLAVVKIADRRPDVAAKLLGEVRAAPAEFVVAPPADRPLAWETTLRLAAVRDEARTSYSGLQTTMSLNQVSVQSCEASLYRTDGGESILDVASECALREQSGRARGEDARDLDLYPFRAHHRTSRVAANASRPTAPIGGDDALPGRDIPPFLSVGDLGLRTARAAAGDRWRTTLRLTILCDTEGRLFTAPFAADVVYAGRADRGGVPCAAFRIDAAPPSELPRSLAERMNRREGEVAGAVFVELATGLVRDATLAIDVALRHATRDGGAKVDDELRITGRYEVRRR